MQFVSGRVAILLAAAATGEDWLQWGGPRRDFKVGSTRVHDWPAGGPRERWSKALGEGYSSMVKSGDLLLTMFRRGSKDVVIAMRIETGETIWESAIDAPHSPGMNTEAGAGPHSTPLIAGGRVFVTGVTGQLAALDLETGKRLWTHDLWKEFNGTILERGYASSPLGYKDTVIVPVGGKGRALMAFRQSDGSTVWSKGDLANGYSSPILISPEGRDQIVGFLAQDVVGSDARTGEVLWSVPHKTMHNINAATPVWCPGIGTLVVSSAYDGGARGIRVGKTATEIWHHRRLRVHHTNMVCAEDMVFGSSGDFGPAPMTAVDARTGAVLWQDRSFSKASFVLAGDTIFAVDDDGSVGMATVTRRGMRLIGEKQLLRANSWTIPLVVDGQYFVRDRHRLISLVME